MKSLSAISKTPKRVKEQGRPRNRRPNLLKVTQKRAYQQTAKPLKEIRNRGGHSIRDLTQKKGYPYVLFVLKTPSFKIRLRPVKNHFQNITFKALNPPFPIPQVEEQFL